MLTHIRLIVLIFGVVFLEILTFPIELYAQSRPPIEWQKAFGGNSGENAIAISLTSDGGCVAIGLTWTLNNGDIQGIHHDAISNSDIWVIKLTASGALQWQKCLGGTSYDQGSSVIQTTDGGYFVSGGTASIDGDIKDTTFKHFRPWVVKLDNLGIIEWEKSIGGAGGEVSSVIQNSDGSLIVYGNSNCTTGDFLKNHGGNDVWVAKLTASGEILWLNCYGGSSDESSRFNRSIAPTSDGGYIFSATTASVDGQISRNDGEYDIWVVKLDSAGSIEWEKCYGGTGTEEASEIQQTADGGYIFAGATNSNDGDVVSHHRKDEDGWVVKLTSSGVIEWEKSYGGSDTTDFINSIIQTKEGGFAFAGSTYSNDEIFRNHGMEDGWIVKLDPTGIRQWQKVMGGGFGDAFYSIAQNSAGEYIIAGFEGGSNPDLIGQDHGEGDCWVVKIGADLGIDDDKKLKDYADIFPNPAINSLNIPSNSYPTNYRIFDMLGRIILSGEITAMAKTSIDISTLSSGTYFIDRDGESGTTRKTFIVQR